MGTSDVSRSFRYLRETGWLSSSIKVLRECLIAEDWPHSIGRELSRRAISEEFEDERDFGEGGKDTSDVELELLILLLVGLESVIFELFENFVINHGVLSFLSCIFIIYMGSKNYVFTIRKG